MAEHHAVRRIESSYGNAERPDPFQLLVAEHAMFRRDLERAGLAADAPGASRRSEGLLGPLTSRFQLHTEREDEVLAPICERLFGGKDGAAAVMREDHAGIKEALRAVDRARDARDRREGIERLSARMEAHFAREEHVLFPLMAAFLSNGEATALARQLRRVSLPARGG